ncbi:hypothetical protein RYX36_023053 [Vicia faba]
MNKERCNMEEKTTTKGSEGESTSKGGSLKDREGMSVEDISSSSKGKGKEPSTLQKLKFPMCNIGGNNEVRMLFKLIMETCFSEGTKGAVETLIAVGRGCVAGHTRRKWQKVEVDRDCKGKSKVRCVEEKKGKTFVEGSSQEVYITISSDIEGHYSPIYNDVEEQNWHRVVKEAKTMSKNVLQIPR